MIRQLKLLFLLLLFPVLLRGQLQETFLMYHKLPTVAYRNSDTVAIRTNIFVLADFLSTQRSTCVIKSLGLIYRNFEDEKWKYTRHGNLFVIRRKNEKRSGIILKDSILNCARCWNDSIEFFLVPVKKGKRFEPFEGQLTWQEKNGHITARTIVLNKYIQGTYSLWNLWISDYGSFVNESRCYFGNDKINNVVFSEVLTFQAVNSKDSIISCDLYNTVVWDGDDVKFSRKLVKKKFPPRSEILEIQNQLDGNWKLSQGFILKDSLKQEALINVNYKVMFKDGEITVKKEFLNKEFRADTIKSKYSIDRSGNLLEVNSLSHPIILQKVEKGKVNLCLSDTWYTRENKPKTVRLILELERK